MIAHILFFLYQKVQQKLLLKQYSTILLCTNARVITVSVETILC